MTELRKQLEIEDKIFSEVGPELEKTQELLNTTDNALRRRNSEKDEEKQERPNISITEVTDART